MAGVIALAVLLAFFAFICWLIYKAFTERNVWIGHTEDLPWSPQDSASHVLAAVMPLMQRWGYRLTTQTPTSAVFSYSYRPGWVAIPCIVFFPIGLLALIYKKTVDVAFNFIPKGDTAGVSVVGKGPPYVRDQIGAHLAKLQTTAPPSGATSPGADAVP